MVNSDPKLILSHLGGIGKKFWSQSPCDTRHPHVEPLMNHLVANYCI